MDCKRSPIKMWSLLFTVYLFSSHVVDGLICKEKEHNFNNQRCCHKCGPGTGVVSPCSLANNTTCEPCRLGSTFSDQYSHQDVCKPCSKCESNSHLKSACNLTSDTLCECDEQYFFNITEQRCAPCGSCPAGFGAYSPCGGRENTRCRLCPNGTYSDRNSPEGCRVCKSCNENQILLQSCSAMQNTICIDMPDGVSSLNGLPVTRSPAAGDEGYNNTASELIPLYCAIMGAVIIAVIIYVVVKHWRRKAVNESRKSSLTPDAEAGPAQGSDSGVIIEQNSKGEITTSTLIRDLPQGKRKLLEKELDTPLESEGGWAGLAKQIGYNTSKIASLEVRAEQDQHTPIRYLLLEWGKDDSATVGVLVHALKDIGRNDIAKVLNGNTDSLKAPENEEV